MFAKLDSSFFARFVLAFAAIPLMANAAAAVPIRYDFGGVIDDVAGATGAVPGARFSGSFVYNPDAAVVEAMTSPYASYTTYRFGSERPGEAADGSGLQLFIEGGASFPLSTGLLIAAYDKDWGHRGDPSDLYVSDHGSRTPWGHVQLHFQGGELPAGSPPREIALSQFATARLYVEPPKDLAIPGSLPPIVAGPSYLGTIDTLTATPIPEPGWTVAALLGAAVWVARRRRAG